MPNSYPCDHCAKRERCNNSGNYQRCPAFRGWLHRFWMELDGAEERVKYRRWLRLMMQRAEWRAEHETD